MKLGVINCDKKLLEWLPKSYDLVYLDKKETGKLPDIDALLIDWMPRYMTNKEKLARQVSLVDIYANKKKTIVLFDRYLDMNEKEYGYLKKFNTFFFEPAVNNRGDFKFLPPWTECYTLETLPTHKKKKRSVDFGYIGSLKNRLSSFEKYYVEFASLYPKYNVCYTASLPKPKIDEYKDAGITKKSFGYEDVKCVLVIDTPKNYEIGYINPDVFDIMHKGVLPLFPVEHRFYHSVFDIIGDVKFISVDIECINDFREVTLLHIYDHIRTIFPEMNIEYTVETIRKCVEK